MIKILKSSDPVVIPNVVVMIYGDPGAGKTSLGFTAHEPLLLDFDRGAHRSGFRRDSVPVEKWSDVEGLTEKDLEPYATIEVDTVGRCLDAMAVSIMNANPKMRGSAGQLSLQGFGALKSQFAGWLRTLRAYGKDVVLIAHGAEQKNGDDLILRPDMQGSSYGEVMKCADGVAYLRMVDKARILAWDPQDRYIGKNPAALEPATVPHLAMSPFYLGEIIDTIKARIGQISADGAAIRAAVDDFRIRIEDSSAAGLSSLVPEANAIEGPAKIQVKALIAARAKTLGLAWDASASAFVAKEGAPTEPAPQPAPAEARTRRGGGRGQVALMEPGESDASNG